MRADVPLALRFVQNPRLKGWRLAVVVSRKVSKAAVVRNRIRRRIFEVVRREGGRIAPQYDLVFSVYGAELATLAHEELRVAVTTQLEKAGVLAQAPAGTQEAPGHGIVKVLNTRETTA